MSTRRRMLLAGGSHSDIPMIKAARALGYHVTTSGNRPADLGHAYADAVRLADFSDRDAILRLAQELGVDAICASCNDFSALSCAWAAEQLGLPGHDSYDVARILHHKDLYRAFASENRIPTPRAHSCTNVEEAVGASAHLRWPLIVKPVDLTGGKGISVARDEAGLRAAAAAALAMTRAGRIVVEEFLEGSRHGFSCLIRRGAVVFHFEDNEHYFLNPYMVSAASTPADLPASAATELIALTERIAARLQLVDGLVHIQFIQTADGPVIIEICRRPPGDLYVDLVRHATGVDYPRLIVQAACGSGLERVTPTPVQGHFVRHCVMSRRSGTVANLHISPVVQDRIIDQTMWWKPGDKIEDVMTQKLGVLFLRFADADEFRDLGSRLQELVHPEFSD
jgi:Biotin carboxylase